MKRFNQTISIEVSVDSIADKLLATFPEDYKHRELLTEAIIAPSLLKGTIGYIYNALNGYSADIDFKESEFVICTERVYDWNNETKEEKRREMGKARIKEINTYSDDKLLVEYYTHRRDGEAILEKKWVSHTNCTKTAEGYFDEECVASSDIGPEQILASLREH